MKKNGKLRPLGIPTIKDRVYQNIVRNALEPQWEARFEAISYGFRPKRSTHDAIRSIFNRINGGTKKKWIFEGDFQGCFDHLNHEWILKQTSYFPGRKLLKRWLKMGYMEQKLFAETQEGTPKEELSRHFSLTLPFMEWKKPWELLTRKTIKLMIVIL